MISAQVKGTVEAVIHIFLATKKEKNPQLLRKEKHLMISGRLSTQLKFTE